MVQLGQSPKGKVLTGAVDAWFKGAEEQVDNSELLEDYKRYGLEPPAELTGEGPEEDDFEVPEEQWNVVAMFLRCSTQWRTSQGGVIGLDYNPILKLLDQYPDEDPIAFLDDIRVMENRALTLFSEKAEKARKREEAKAKRKPRRR